MPDIFTWYSSTLKVNLGKCILKLATHNTACSTNGEKKYKWEWITLQHKRDNQQISDYSIHNTRDLIKRFSIIQLIYIDYLLQCNVIYSHSELFFYMHSIEALIQTKTLCI